MSDIGVFALFAAATFIAGSCLCGFGIAAMLNSGISERRRAVYGLLAVVPTIPWVAAAGWTWDEHGAAFTIWAAVIGLVVPGIITLIGFGVVEFVDRRRRPRDTDQ